MHCGPLGKVLKFCDYAVIMNTVLNNKTVFFYEIPQTVQALNAFIKTSQSNPLNVSSLYNESWFSQNLSKSRSQS